MLRTSARMVESQITRDEAAEKVSHKQTLHRSMSKVVISDVPPVKLRLSWWKRNVTTPFFVPTDSPVELFFFHLVFLRLVRSGERGVSLPEAEKDVGDMIDGDAEVPISDFQRAMVRFFKAIRSDYVVDVLHYDTTGNGYINWYEFCKFWQDCQAAADVSIRFSLAERIFLTLEDSDKSIIGKILSFLMLSAIVLSVGSFVASTMPEFQDLCAATLEPGFDPDCFPAPQLIFKDIELACVLFFTLEYCARLLLSGFMRWELVDRDRKNQPGKSLVAMMCDHENVQLPTFVQRVKHFFFDASNLIDLAAIIPWYLAAALESGPQGESPVLQIIRLTRVFRAFRLGRRFEAVIIIARSLKRSVRALYVLTLNLILGMIIFGALMYFAEQGSWDPATNEYLRQEGEVWNSTTLTWYPNYNRSPFESIPASFWWAIVTATTVGYGDGDTPTTSAGKVVAGVTMVWSLCVLALPIGVIGSNFSQVWTDYDREKIKEASSRRQQEAMVRKSMAWSDPLYFSKLVVIEVWHNSGLCSPLADGVLDISQSEFLGEVECQLDLRREEPMLGQRIHAALVANSQKACRKVTGTLTFEYSWMPHKAKMLMAGDDGDDLLMAGKLDVSKIRADNILNIDYKGRGMSDPFCVVRANTGKPRGDGPIEQTILCTDTLFNSSSPRWTDTLSFRFCWHQVQDAVVEDLRRTKDEKSKGPAPMSNRRDVLKASSRSKSLRISATTTDDLPAIPQVELLSATLPTQLPELSDLQSLIPQLQADLSELKDVVPKLQAELSSVSQDMKLMLRVIQQRKYGHAHMPSALSNGSVPKSGPSIRGPENLIGGSSPSRRSSMPPRISLATLI